MSVFVSNSEGGVAYLTVSPMRGGVASVSKSKKKEVWPQ